MKEPLRHPDQPTLRHLEQLMAGLLDGVILIDATGTILSANDAALRMHGIKNLAELGTTAEGYAQRFSLRTPDNRVMKHREYPLFRLLAGETFPDLIVEVASAGEEQARWVHQVRDVVMDVDGGDVDYMALVINDVSARFDAEARFNAMFNANPAPALVVRTVDQRIVQVNHGFEDLADVTSDQLIGKSLLELDLLQNIVGPATVKRQMANGEIIRQTEAELHTANGSNRQVLFAGQPIDVTDDDALLLTFADLEPRRRAETALAASQDDLLAVFEMAPVAMAVTLNANRRVSSVNAAFRRLTGYNTDQIVGRTVDEFHRWDHADRREALETQLAERESVRNAAIVLLTVSLAEIECVVSAEGVSMGGQPCTLWVYQDVTERKQNERELAQAIDAVMKDTNWLSHSILDKLATLRRPVVRGLTMNISPREREILDLICDGLDDDAIATRLVLSRNTVRNHVARLYSKLGVNRRSGAVVWGRERGMGSMRT